MTRTKTAFRTLMNHMIQVCKSGILTELQTQEDIDKGIPVKSIPVIHFVNSDNCKPKQFIGESLGFDHWSLNYKGKQAPYLYKGNYDEYVSPDGKMFTEYEVIIFNCGRVWQDTMQQTRSSLFLAQNHAETPEVWQTLRRGCMRIVTDINTYKGKGKGK